MKRVVLGFAIAVCTLLTGIGSDRVAMGVLDWQSLPELAVVPDTRIYNAELCDLLGNPGKFNGRIVRVKVQRGIAGGTFFGLLSANECPGFVHAQCPDDGTCSILPNLVGQTEFAKTDAVVIGKFFAGNGSIGPFARDRQQPLIAIQTVVEIKPLADCPDGSKVEPGTECPYKEIDLRIGGVDIGSRHREVIKALGQPIRSVRGRYHEGSSEHELTLKYDGLSIDLLYVPDRVVVAFQVTSPKWNVSGIRVGDYENVLKPKFGEALYGPVEDPDVKGGYIYASEAGVYLTIKVRDGKIVEIWAAMPTC